MAMFYRIVKTNPPTVADFLTDQQAGRPRPRPDLLRFWEGRSMFDSEAAARQTARRFRSIGAFIAAVDIPDDGPFSVERSFLTPGHYTIWGDAVAIFDRVRSVVSV